MTHIALGWCIWDIPALIVLVAIVVIFAVRLNKMKKREDAMEAELAQTDAGKPADGANQN